MMGAADWWIEHVLGRLSSALADVPAAERQDIIVLQFQGSDEDDDARRPLIDIAWNTAAHLREQQTVWTGADCETCEWLTIHYRRRRAVTVGSDEHDREGASLVRAWLEEIGLWYEDGEGVESEDTNLAIWDAFMELTVVLVRRLRESGLLEREIGRDVPIFINSQLAGTDELRDFNRRANPPAFHEQLHRWSTRGVPE
jgi:hypothetical protein